MNPQYDVGRTDVEPGWIVRMPPTLRRSSMRAPAMICVAIGLLLLAGSFTWAQSPPLAISLSGPEICENDASTNSNGVTLDAPEVEITWAVTGGSAPYEVLVHGQRRSGDSGHIRVLCSVWSDEWRSASGDIAVPATVTDAEGRQASAIHDIYSIRSYRDMGNQSAVNSAYRSHRLSPDGTYRVHGHLLTIPEGYAVQMREHLSADCASPGPDCLDRFRLQMYEAIGNRDNQGHVWINRWTGSEHSRWLDSSSGRRGVLVLADDPDAEIPAYEHRASELFDRLLDSQGQSPGKLVVSAAGTHRGQLSIALALPRLCRGISFSQDSGLPVHWTIEGGIPPYEVTIGGSRYLGREGVHWLKCVFEPGRALDSGERTIQAVVVDGRGDTAAAHGDMLVARWFSPGHWQVEHLTAGKTYLIGNWFGTPPPGAQVRLVAPFQEERYCESEDSGGEEQLCDYAMNFEVEQDGAIGSLKLGAVAGDEYARELPNRASAALNQAIDAFVASIGQRPQPGEDFRDASGPPPFRWLANPGECVPGGSVYVEVRVTGGQWWPPWKIELGEQEEFLANTERGGQTSFFVPCGEASQPLELELRAVELRYSPLEFVTTIADEPVVIGVRDSNQGQYDNDTYTQVGLGIDHGRCVAGEQFGIDWHSRPTSGHEGRISVTVDGLAGVHGPEGAVQVRCAEPPGPHLITIRIRADFDPPQFETLDFVYESVAGRPERVAR